MGLRLWSLVIGFHLEWFGYRVDYGAWLWSLVVLLVQYNQTEDLAIGAYDFTREDDTMVPIELCKHHYKDGDINAFNESFVFDSTQETSETAGKQPLVSYCILLTSVPFLLWIRGRF